MTSECALPGVLLGGYFMRQRRLQILSYLLSNADQEELKQILIQFGDMTFDRKAILLKKAMEELRVCLNQWNGNLQKYLESEAIEMEYYATDAEVRTMISDLIFELEIDLYLVDKENLRQMDALDEALKHNWQEGNFIWPEDWMPAYGKGDYWWLYGKPKSRIINNYV